MKITKELKLKLIKELQIYILDIENDKEHYIKINQAS